MLVLIDAFREVATATERRSWAANGNRWTVYFQYTLESVMSTKLKPANTSAEREKLKRLHWHIHTHPAQDEPDAIFYTVTCDEIPGLIHTATQLDRCMSDAIEGALQFVRLVGISPTWPEMENSPRSSQMNLKLSDEEYGAIRRAASASGATASAFVRKAALDAANAGQRNYVKPVARRGDVTPAKKKASRARI